ncbi:hypothetical protein PMIN06_011655 [Paraphaeosphaeria minitans]|uniref:Uncharacterized protein n=1 Tax=Paraphaeosphaeria minitans TaxID=565426 RepID=A0A9P6GKZ8_9PLEO|nr:hypothetical protein PMIN01_05341 [Paraphaeosphaeria minitans]
MPNLRFPSNPTSYRTTGWQIALMLLMGINHLMDHDPRHIQYSKDQRAKRKAEKQRYKSGFVVELPDEEAKDKDKDKGDEPVHPDAARQTSRPHSPCCNPPPPVRRDGKEAWPYPRGASHHKHGENIHDDKIPCKHPSKPKPTGRAQMRDAWTRMRAFTKTPYEYVKRVDSRKKRVKFNRDVQWFVFDGDADDSGGDYGESISRRR